jgi:broad specificity phosphatase PhoE
VTRLYVVRHGQTAWNVAGRLQGSSDQPLNDLGRAQAKRSAASLARVLQTPCVIVSSPLARALDTAVAIADAVGTDVHTDARLSERAYGVWEGLTWDERYARDPAESERWLARKEPQIEGYEGHEAVVARMRAALDDWLPHVPQGELVFVTHGSSARMLMLSLLDLATDTHALSSLENAAWSRLCPVDDAPWSLERHNIGADG